MEREELKNKIVEVIETSKLASVATIKDDKPWVRYMVIQHDKDLICYTAAFAMSRKIEQINKNNNIHIAIGGNPKNWDAPYVNMQAKAENLTDLETKRKY